MPVIKVTPSNRGK